MIEVSTAQLICWLIAAAAMLVLAVMLVCQHAQTNWVFSLLVTLAGGGRTHEFQFSWDGNPNNDRLKEIIARIGKCAIGERIIVASCGAFGLSKDFVPIFVPAVWDTSVGVKAFDEKDAETIEARLHALVGACLVNAMEKGWRISC